MSKLLPAIAATTLVAAVAASPASAWTSPTTLSSADEANPLAQAAFDGSVMLGWLDPTASLSKRLGAPVPITTADPFEKVWDGGLDRDGNAIVVTVRRHKPRAAHPRDHRRHPAHDLRQHALGHPADARRRARRDRGRRLGLARPGRLARAGRDPAARAGALRQAADGLAARAGQAAAVRARRRGRGRPRRADLAGPDRRRRAAARRDRGRELHVRRRPGARGRRPLGRRRARRRRGRRRPGRLHGPDDRPDQPARRLGHRRRARSASRPCSRPAARARPPAPQVATAFSADGTATVAWGKPGNSYEEGGTLEVFTRAPGAAPSARRRRSPRTRTGSCWRAAPAPRPRWPG